ncbi:MAG: IS3 family transposase [Verrucomicrobiota bacterium]
MIDSMRKTHSIRGLCEILGISRSGYYASKRSKISSRAIEERVILKEIRAIHAHRHMKVYGSPRMTKELHDRGIACGRHRVARLMRENRIVVRRRKSFRPRTTQVDKNARIAPNLLAAAPTPKAPGQQLVSDITYLRTREGWLYPSIVVDLFSRAIIGWDLSDSLAAQSACKAISKARRSTRMQNGCIFHSDRGCQYTSDLLRKELGGSIRQSMSAKGYCYDNAFAESCFATIKAELLPSSQIFDSKIATRRAVFDYIETFYNRTRRHSALGQISPLQFLQLYKKQQNKHLN